ncbi:MAG TPA: SH3 domain-containing protein, partial [Xanthomonadales bacterium]|nr:SH3 domain-containing protein [Xanthomonadales bacterium]
PPRTRRSLESALALDSIPTRRPARFGLVTQRAPLRAFPTRTRVFNSAGNTDIDRFQENALFPGTPVVIAHESRDGEWWFVVSALYEAWVEKRYVALGDAATVFGYGRKTPYVVVTGATARTVYTPDLPQLSELQLDMGVRVPLLADWPADRPVNGQHPYTNHVVELPLRRDDGSLALAPALLPRTADVSTDYLPLTRANLLRQGFKFLGERYGWGHDYNARDCSGFVSEVYRSFGVTLPRNTRDQAVSPAYDRIAFDPATPREQRIAVLRELEVGDLVYIPGHVMMVIGHERGEPYVIHDTVGIGYRDAAGAYRRVALNGVSVTPLLPLHAGEDALTIDRITSIQRIRPAAGADRP